MNGWYRGNSPRQSRWKNTARAPVEVVILVCWIFFSVESNASTGPSWSQQPAWANGEPAPAAHKTSARSHDISTGGSEVAPFSPGSHNLALDLGQVFLMGDMSKYADSIGTQLHYNYGVSDIFAFDASVGYSEHSDGKFSMTTLLTGMRLNLSWYDKVVPYAVVGLGFYRPSYQDTTGGTPTIPPGKTSADIPNISAVLFGVHLGPGVDLELSKNFFFGAAVTFHNMFGTTKTMADGKTPLSIGGIYTSFFLHIGVTF